jgi:hypothetical protein
MFDAKFKLAAASLIRAAMVEDFDTAELTTPGLLTLSTGDAMSRVW